MSFLLFYKFKEFMILFRNLISKNIVCLSKKHRKGQKLIYVYLIDQQSNISMHLIINKQNIKNKIKASVTEISKLYTF